MVTGAARTRQQVEELSASTLRAVAGDRLLHLHGGRLHRGEQPVPATAAHLRPDPGDDLGSFRGAADGLALRRLHSDARVHAGLRPAEDVSAMLFDLLEQFRTEALVAATMPGVAANLRHRFRVWLAAFRASGLADTQSGILLYTLACVCRSRVTGEPVDGGDEELIEATRFALAPEIGSHLESLRRHRHQQQRYGVTALAIAEHAARLLATTEADAGETAAGGRAMFSLFVDGDDDASPTVAVSADSRVLGAADGGYRVFTRSYDREVRAGELVRPAQLRLLRDRLDDRVATLGIGVGRLAARLRALLTEPARDGWDGDREEGRVDGRRLARLVTSPEERRLFRDDLVAPVADAQLTFLVDCSGSMRRHADTVTALLDVLLRALDLAGVTTELLGFTTGAWNGGRAVRDWRRAGRPPQPGRLNEQLHLVVKEAETSWRRARPSVAALLKEDLYREGADGEAVAWAAARMASRPEQHKILVVVSDGSPMDSATNLTNDEHYLDQHLRQVLAGLEAAGEVTVCGLGVGLDLSPFYRRSVVLDLTRPVGGPTVRELLGLLAHARRRW
jgi:cobaltochelatase CobT